MTPGERLRETRIQKGMTQQQLADAAGLSAPAIRFYEKDERTMKGARLDAIAEALVVSPEFLSHKVPESAREAMVSLFSLEDEFGLRPDAEGNLVVDPANKMAPKLTVAIKAWHEKMSALRSGEINKVEYELGRAISGSRNASEALRG